MINKYFYLVLLFLFIVFASTSHALSLVPRPGDYWFIYNVKVNENTLPPGITFGNNNLVNSTLDPLYIFDGKQIMLILKSNKAFVEETILGKSDHEWIESTSENDFKFLSENDSKISQRLILDRPSENIERDNRPEIVSIPKPHTFILNTKYKEEPLEITGVIEYNLNPNYDPHKGYSPKLDNQPNYNTQDTNKEKGNKLLNKSQLNIITGIVVILVTSFFLFIIIKHKNKKS